VTFEPRRAQAELNPLWLSGLIIQEMGPDYAGACPKAWSHFEWQNSRMPWLRIVEVKEPRMSCKANCVKARRKGVLVHVRERAQQFGRHMNLVKKCGRQNGGGTTEVCRIAVHTMFRIWAGAALVGLVLTVHPVARAAVDTSVEIGVNSSYAGTAPKSSTTPWVDSFFEDVAPDTVRLTITADNLANPEYLQSLYLNFNDTKQVTSLIFTPVFSLWQGVDHDFSLQLNRNNEQAATGGNFDILLGFSSSPGASRRFGTGDEVVFDITTAQANTSLSSLDFAMRSVPGSAGSFYAAAFIERTGSNHKDSDFAGATTFTVLGVPEPASGFAAASVCLVGLAIYLRRGMLRRIL